MKTDIDPDVQSLFAQIEALSSTTDKIRFLNAEIRKLPCERPLAIHGKVISAETGELFGTETLEMACNSAFWSVCRSCSVRHGQSAWLIGKSGISGLDSESFDAPVPIDQYFGFLTLTAPSFGRVHTKGRCSCGKHHSEHADVLHLPLNYDDYDIDGAATFNLVATRLLNRTKTKLRRRFPHANIEYFGAVEPQKRGLMHVHLLIRSAYPLNPAQVRDCVSSVKIFSKPNRKGGSICWGSQTDFSPVESNDAASERVFKYAMKSLRYTLKDHANTMDGESHDGWQVSKRAKKFYLELEKRASEIRESGNLAGVKTRFVNSSAGGFAGYTGHRMQKSRGWSALTFLSLRRARAKYMNRKNGTDESSPVVWRAIGDAFFRGVDRTVRAVADELKRDLDVLARRSRREAGRSKIQI